jgi:hypothetical protein
MPWFDWVDFIPAIHPVGVWEDGLLAEEGIAARIGQRRAHALRLARSAIGQTGQSEAIHSPRHPVGSKIVSFDCSKNGWHHKTLS